MKTIIFYFFALSLLHSKVSSRVLNVKVTNETPGFDVTTDNVRSGIPEITVHFANGINERMVLDHYGQNDAGSCNYIGYLAESKGNVAVTGCLQKSGDKMDITLLSKYSRNRMFSLDFDGKVNIIKNPFLSGATSRVVRGADRIDDDDNDEVDGDPKAEAAATAIEKTEKEFKFPESMPARIKFGYETSMKSKLTVLGVSFKAFVDSVMAHVQTYYKDPSLTTQIIIDYDASDDLIEDVIWTAQDNLADAAKVTKRVAKDEYDLYAWYVADVDSDGNSKYGTSGIAYLGMACEELKTSINEWWGKGTETDTAGSAYILAHELGHNFGMDHDFGTKHGGTEDYKTSTNECNGKGIMSYGDGVPTVWSSCSVADFSAYYQLRDWGCYCLKDDSDTALAAACCKDCGQNDCDPDTKLEQSWADWGACNNQCGNGYRTRFCGDNKKSESEKCKVTTDCCATNAAYTDLGGSYRCTCPAGMTGDVYNKDATCVLAPCADARSDCAQNVWACTSTQYAWFKDVCRKTCKVC